MTDDIVEDLRGALRRQSGGRFWQTYFLKAADEIERLREERTRYVVRTPQGGRTVIGDDGARSNGCGGATNNCSSGGTIGPLRGDFGLPLDIVALLRERGLCSSQVDCLYLTSKTVPCPVCSRLREAADEIERLRGIVNDLRSTLGPHPLTVNIECENTSELAARVIDSWNQMRREGGS